MVKWTTSAILDYRDPIISKIKDVIIHSVFLGEELVKLLSVIYLNSKLSKISRLNKLQFFYIILNQVLVN